MNIQENVPLAPLTTFHIGGPARFFIEAHTEQEVEEAIIFARDKKMQMLVLGNGSNVLVPDEGVDGVVMHITARTIIFQEEGDDTLLIADAGALWEEIVDAVNERGLFGIENLAGIPGTMGGAVAQNIGAYGAELSQVFEYADVINTATGARERIKRTEAEFGYRTSFFKTHRELIVMRVALRLSKQTPPNLSYLDLALVLRSLGEAGRAGDSGATLETPADISRAVRAIRTAKFPRSPDEGTAGSFFKNPCVSQALADSIAERFPGVPLFPQNDGTVKVALAWLLDHALSLKGYAEGQVRLYEKQPLVIATSTGATATEVDAFANKITERVFSATGIRIEREVEMFGTQK